MPPRRRYDRQERPTGPRYHCFLCQRSMDSPIQACPKHEPELHRKLTDLRKKRETRAAERPEGRESGKKPRAKAPAGKGKEEAKKPAEEKKKPVKEKKEAAAPDSKKE